MTPYKKILQEMIAFIQKGDIDKIGLARSLMDDFIAATDDSPNGQAAALDWLVQDIKALPLASSKDSADFASLLVDHADMQARVLEDDG